MWVGVWVCRCHVTNVCVVSVAASLAAGAPHSGEGGAGQDAQGGAGRAPLPPTS